MNAYFNLEIESGSSAFSDDPGGEVIRIMKEVIKRMESGRSDGKVQDYNGNNVGKYSFYIESEPEELETGEDEEESQ